MKRLKISSLMDEYTDTEFFPAEGSAVSPERVKGLVLAQATAAAPIRRKQKMPRKKKLLLAAALAAAMVLLMAAGYPYIKHSFADGKLTFEQTGDGRITTFEQIVVVRYEEGRLIFTRDDGQHMDITDLVSEETPYIYDGSDPDTGLTYYVIIGGTPVCFGWFEWIQVPYPFDDDLAINFDESGNPVQILYDFVLIDRPTDNDGHSVFGAGNVKLDESMNLPWLLAGAEQLGITFVEPSEYR